MTNDQEIATVTPERRKRGKIVEAPRGAIGGGNVAGIGQHDAWAFYPDFLIDQNLLGEPADATRRRNAAYGFLDLWSQTHRSEKSCVPDGSAGAQPGEKPTEQGEVNSFKALMEKRWLLVQVYLGKHLQLVQTLCLDLIPPSYPVSVDGLAELKRSEKPADLRKAADLIETRLRQQSSISVHVSGFLTRAGAFLDALDVLEEALHRAKLETPTDGA